MEFEFKLTYKLPTNEAGADLLMTRLGEEGCTDALVGFGVAGQVGLEFVREASTAEEAILTALEDVKRALPGAKLIEAGPDFVGLTDVAELVGLSRQNIRKLWLNNENAFPLPVHSGASSFWHLAQVLQFLNERQYSFAQKVQEVAHVTMKLNIARQKSMVSDTELEEMQRHGVF
jgi:predicted DNA-binding transcriptional regulator AlpA